MKLADTFKSWLQQPLDPPSPGALETESIPDPELVPGAVGTRNPNPLPFDKDGREPDPAHKSNAWLCPHCRGQVSIDEVFPAADGSGLLTLWSCVPCQAVGLTPAAIKAPPSDVEPSNFAPIPLAPEPPPLDPATKRMIAAAIWLEFALTEPRRVTEVIAEWTGGVPRVQPDGAVRWERGTNGTDGHWIADLNAAATFLRVKVLGKPDGRWWIPPPETVADIYDRIEKERMSAP